MLYNANIILLKTSKAIGQLVKKLVNAYPFWRKKISDLIANNGMQ